MITSLRLENFRSVADLDIVFPVSSEAGGGTSGEPSPIVLFFGANAQGKTTLLEGLHLLLTGRSFRTSILDQAIGPANESMLARGTIALLGQDHRAHHRIGVLKKRKTKVQVSMDGSAVKSSMSLARVLPVQVVDHQSLQIVLGEPGVRRRFLDWGAFHVEHEYGPLYKKWQAALNQRNAVLKVMKRSGGRTSQQELTAWTETYAKLSVQVARVRQRYFDLFSTYLENLRSDPNRPRSNQGSLSAEFGIPGLHNFDIRLKHGFAFDADVLDVDQILKFSDELGEKRDIEVVLGRTHSGPQRADLLMSANDQSAKEILSRGQCKLVAAFLLLHQVQHLRQRNAAGPAVVLVDDLTAELDHERAADLLHQLSMACSQLFVTALAAKQDELPQFLKDLENASSASMFHVEQGQVHAVGGHGADQ